MSNCPYNPSPLSHPRFRLSCLLFDHQRYYLHLTLAATFPSDVRFFELSGQPKTSSSGCRLHLAAHMHERLCVLCHHMYMFVISIIALRFRSFATPDNFSGAPFKVSTVLEIRPLHHRLGTPTQLMEMLMHLQHWGFIMSSFSLLCSPSTVLYDVKEGRRGVSVP
jgi:hypothetical protein